MREEKEQEYNFCYYCGQKTTELVRVEKTDKGEKVYWANTTKVCENPNCPLFVKVAKIKNWKRI